MKNSHTVGNAFKKRVWHLKNLLLVRIKTTIPKMVYRRKGAMKRRRTRRPRTVKAIAKRVVKNVLSKQVERKYKTFLMGDKQVMGTVLHWFNPLYKLTKGDNPDQRVGDKLSNVRLDLALSYWHEGLPYGESANLAWLGSRLRVIVFKTRQRIPESPDATGYSNSLPVIGEFKGLFLNDFQGSFAPINKHDYTVVYDKTMSSYKPFFTSYASFGVPAQMRVSIPLCKEFRFSSLGKDDLAGTAWSTQSNYYVAVVSSAVSADDVDKIGRLQSMARLSWTDA